MTAKAEVPTTISCIKEIKHVCFQVLEGFNGEKRLLIPKKGLIQETATVDFIIFKLFNE